MINMSWLDSFLSAFLHRSGDGTFKATNSPFGQNNGVAVVSSDPKVVENLPRPNDLSVSKAVDAIDSTDNSSLLKAPLAAAQLPQQSEENSHLVAQQS